MKPGSCQGAFIKLFSRKILDLFLAMLFASPTGGDKESRIFSNFLQKNRNKKSLTSRVVSMAVVSVQYRQRPNICIIL